MSEEHQRDIGAALSRRDSSNFEFYMKPHDGGWALARSDARTIDTPHPADLIIAWKPTLAELQDQILKDDAAHFTLAERYGPDSPLARHFDNLPGSPGARTMDPLGTTDPLGRIEPRKDDDLRIPDWPKVQKETPSQAPPALKDEPSLLSRAYSWLEARLTPQQARSLQEDQVQTLRILPPTLKPDHG